MITLDYFKSFGNIKDVKVYQSTAFFNIAIYPESSIILNSMDMEEYTEKLKENNFEIKRSPDLMVIEFDVVEKCITLSLNFKGL